MKVNTTVALTLILLSLMVGAGVVSAAWGFALGREALKGITQPDTSPTSNLARKQQNDAKTPFKILQEAEILKRVKARMEGKDEKPATPEKSPQSSLTPSQDLPGVVSPHAKISVVANTQTQC